MNITDDQLKQRDAMSDTPRTDAATKTYIWNGVKHIFVEADFARQLERELAAVTAERDVLRADLCVFAIDMEKQLSAVTTERDALDKDAHSLSALLQDCRALFNCIATDDNEGGEFQIDHHLRKQLDTLSEQIKTII